MNIPKPAKIPSLTKLTAPKLTRIPVMPVPKLGAKIAKAPGVKLPEQKLLKVPKEPSVRFPWLGNKTGTPRLPGAGKQHRAEQVSASGYTDVPTVKF